MSDEKFRRDLNQVFEEVAGSPSSNLRHRVRSAVTTTPEARGPYWIAGVAAAVIAALIVGVLVVNGPLKRNQSPAGAPRVTPSQAASPTPFLCQLQNSATTPPASSSVPPVAYISSLRIETKSGYDELTVEFANGVPHDVEVSAPGDGTTFTLSPSGQQVTLKGSKGIMVTIHGADLHTSYSGPTDIVTGDSTIAEVRRVQDFEGVVQLGLGVNGSGCYLAFWMSNPDRLVIDVQAG